MPTISVGQPFGQFGPRSEGFELSLGGSSPELLPVLTKITEAEVTSVTTGPARFGVLETNGVLFFLFRFDPAIGWSDTPYHRALEEAVRPVNLQLLTEQSRALLMVYLISAEDSILRGIRAVTLNPEATRALWQAVLLQDKLPPDYDARIQQVYHRLNSSQMAREAVISKGGE
jgi:hypothetical protein